MAGASSMSARTRTTGGSCSRHGLPSTSPSTSCLGSSHDARILATAHLHVVLAHVAAGGDRLGGSARHPLVAHQRILRSPDAHGDVGERRRLRPRGPRTCAARLAATSPTGCRVGGRGAIPFHARGCDRRQSHLCAHAAAVDRVHLAAEPMPHLKARVLAGLACVLVTQLAHAHVPQAQGSGTPLVMALLVLFGFAYAAGVARLHRHVTARNELYWRTLAFAAGWVALALALLSPLDTAAATAFSLHMIQHEVLMLVAAPLLVLGRGLPTMLWAFSHAARLSLGRASRTSWLRGAWYWLTAPLTAWLLHAAALWVWHIPKLFNAALANPTVHDFQHLSFLATALIFWHALLRHGA